ATFGGENAKQPGGKQSSVADPPEHRMIVREHDDESGGHAIDFREKREFLLPDMLDDLGLVEKTLMAHGEETPIPLPGGVVDLPAAGDLVGEIRAAQVAKNEPSSTECTLGMIAIAVG